MGILESILAAIISIFKAIPLFDKWFSKSPTQKIEDEKKDLDQEAQEMKDDGRPLW